MYIFIALLGVILIVANRNRLSMLGTAFAQVVAGLCLALAIGLTLGTVVGESSAAEAGYTAIFTLLLAFPSVWLLGRIGPAPRGVDLPEDAPRRRLFWQRASPAELPGHDAWTALARATPDQSARIAVARRSATRLLRAAASPNPPEDPGEMVNLIRKHVSPAIRSALAEAASQTGPARTATLETLVDTLEDLAAEAERVLASRSRTSDGNREVAVLRRRLEAMERRGPI